MAATKRIVIQKSAHILTVTEGNAVLTTYRVAIGRGSAGNKVHAGDNRTPEGLYTVNARNEKSQYHKALHLSYPNAEDTARAMQAGVDPGGDIMIHGIKNGWGWIGPLHRLVDWTKGCIAVTNQEIDELWKQIPNGTVVEIQR